MGCTRLAIAFSIIIVSACGQTPAPSAAGTPDQPKATQAAPPVAPIAAAPKADLSSSPLTPGAHSGTAASTAPAASSPPEAPIEPQLVDEHGKMLEQTRDRPSDESPVFKRRLQLFFDAIVHDDPEKARPLFFPIKAYEQVKAIADPARDWNRRLWRLFERDIHDYHRKLGANPEQAKLVRIEMRDANTRWMKPHSEGNRIGYWRVTRNRLHYTDAGGKDKTLEITSFISWRGEWYVVHVHGYK